MAITSDQTPNKGSVTDALAAAAEDPDLTVPMTTEELDEARPGSKPTNYVVLISQQAVDGPYTVLGEFEVLGGQRAARKAAINQHAGLKETVLSGQQVWLAAVATWQPTQPGVRNRDPEITV